MSHRPRGACGRGSSSPDGWPHVRGDAGMITLRRPGSEGNASERVEFSVMSACTEGGHEVTTPPDVSNPARGERRRPW
jgi:hypothetical protein